MRYNIMANFIDEFGIHDYPRSEYSLSGAVMQEFFLNVTVEKGKVWCVLKCRHKTLCMPL